MTKSMPGMKRILIFESNPQALLEASLVLRMRGNAERYGDALLACSANLEIRIVHPYSQAFHVNELQLDDVDGAVFTGSGVTWSTDAQEAKPLRNVMEKVFAAGKPVLGSCNGLQVATVVLGGKVRISPNGKEIGVARNIRLTPEGRTHPLHRGRRVTFASPCIHRDEVSEPPPGALVTASNDHSHVQAMVYERNGVKYWGMQYHPESTPGHFADLIDEPDGLFSEGRGMIADLRKLDTELTGEVARRLDVEKDDFAPNTRMCELSNWLEMLFLSSR